MKRLITKVALMVIAGQLLPSVLFGQGLSGEIASFQSVLEGLYDEMIPLCSKLIGVGRGLAGFGPCGTSPPGFGGTLPVPSP
jgi:hypothetical protein